MLFMYPPFDDGFLDLLTSSFFLGETNHGCGVLYLLVEINGGLVRVLATWRPRHSGYVKIAIEAMAQLIVVDDYPWK